MDNANEIEKTSDKSSGVLPAVEGVVRAVGEVTKELRELFLKPVAEEAGSLLAEGLRFLRWKNALRIRDKAICLLRERGIDPSTFNPKVLVPILQECSLEDDDGELSLMWAGLLASAVAGDLVESSYARILADLSAVQVRILDWMYQEAVEFQSSFERAPGSAPRTPNPVPAEEICRRFQITREDFQVIADNLYRLRLWEPAPKSNTQLAVASIDGGRGHGPSYDVYDWAFHYASVLVTPLGCRFVKACRGPDVKK